MKRHIVLEVVRLPFGNNLVRRDSSPAVKDPAPNGVLNVLLLRRFVTMIVIIELRNLRIVALNQTPAWRVPLLRGQREAGILLQRIHGLDQAFTETRFTDDDGAIMVLQGARNDLGGAR